MKTALILLCFILNPALPWLNNFDTARQEAVRSHKLILLNFSGSDWCGPCIRMRKEIFGSSEFTAYAAENLILVQADFPRQKKNQLSHEQTVLNEQLADKYNPEGKFPLTLLINEHGGILKTWDGFPSMKPAQFVTDLTLYKHAARP